MRDLNRIPSVVKKLEVAWKLVADWRLGQLMSNLHGLGRQDVFNTEDDELEKMLDRFISNYK